MSDARRLGAPELDAIEQRAALATPGPWVAVGQNIDRGAPHPDGQRILSGGNACQDDDYSEFTAVDCAFIAASRDDVPRLIAALREAWGEIERLKLELNPPYGPP